MTLTSALTLAPTLTLTLTPWLAAGDDAATARAVGWLRTAAAAAEGEGEAAQAQLVMSGCASYLIITHQLPSRLPPLSTTPALWCRCACLSPDPPLPYPPRCSHYQVLEKLAELQLSSGDAAGASESY